MDPPTETLVQGLPSVPVVLGHSVLNGDERIGVDQTGQVVDHLTRTELATLEAVPTLPVDLGRGDIEGEGNLFANFVSGSIDRLHQQVESGFASRQLGGEASFIADVGGEAKTGDHSFEGVIDLDAGPKGLGE